MAIRRYGSFAGGIDLPDEKGATLGAPIRAIGAPDRLRVPLAPTPAPAARPVVAVGEAVLAGQCIARADHPDQVDVYAPLGGRVAAIGEALLPAPHGHWRRCGAVELVELAAPAAPDKGAERFDWRGADEDALRRRIDEGALTTFRRPVTALGGWVARARSRSVGTLIANVTENVPRVTADHRVLAEHGPEVVSGLAILARAIGAERVILAVDGGRTAAYREAVAPARRCGIDTVALPRKYPIGIDAMIVKVLARREVPPGGSPFDVGVAVTNAATCLALCRWVARGERPLARVVTLSGEGASEKGNFLVPFGADAGAILGGGDVRVHGSPMRGLLLAPGAVVGPACDALVALPASRVRPPTPCIRCGWCGENCPARLDVAGLNDDFELSRVDRAARRGAPACVDCGICSYVCPAHLPLTERVAALKEAIRLERGLHKRVEDDG